MNYRKTNNRQILKSIISFLLFFATNFFVNSGNAEAKSANLYFRISHFPVGRNPASVAVGDLNKDGVLDIVTANYVSEDVSVLLGNGDGSFQDAQSFTNIGEELRSIDVGDFNGDRILDLVITPSRNDNVSILVGNGDGSFRAPQFFPTGEYPVSVVVEDFNGDSILDLATANESSDDVSVLLGNGDGSFQAPQFFPIGESPWGVEKGDLNGDRILDLVTTNANPDNVSVLLGNNDGSFQEPKFYPTGEFPIEIAIGDFNNDGALDLATANEESNNYSILFGNGDGSFQNPQSLSPTGFSGDVAVGDFNIDGLLDLVTCDAGSDDVTILLGNGDGSFQEPQSFSVGDYSGAGPGNIAVGDFNNDGALDLATTYCCPDPDSVAVLIQTLPEVVVDLDIKPGACPNPMRLKCTGVLPAAILGTDAFDVNTINPATIMIMREGIPRGVPLLRHNYADVGTPFEGELCDCDNLGKDGYMDLTLKFKVSAVVEGLKLYELADRETIPLTIVGETYAGTPIRGEDCVWIIGNLTKECKPDHDCDADVDGTDAAMFKEEFGRKNCNKNNPCIADFQSDGDIDGSDVFIFKSEYGTIFR